MSLRSKRRLRLAGSVLAALAVALGLAFAYMGQASPASQHPALASSLA